MLQLRHPTFTSALLLGLCCSDAFGATFQWNNLTQNWSAPAGWAGGVVPTGTNPTDILSFAGDTGTVIGTAPNYTATNDIAPSPFLLNAISLNATNVSALPTDPALNITGGVLRFGGTNPEIVQNGAGGFTFITPLVIPSTMRFGGNGTGGVTLNRGVSGLGTIVKDGASVFRFGTTPVLPAVVGPSENTWFGPLVINAGIVRFNNNADSGRTAIRGNPVTLAAGATLTCTSELRLGVLAGGGGTVESQVTATDADTEDIIISAFGSGTFSGTVRLGIPTGAGNDVGELVVRGPGEQTLSGTVNITKDLVIGGNLVLGGTASLSTQTTGAVVMNGGTLRLDNSITNANRLRDGSATSTGLDTIGGGLFQLSGNVLGSAETIGRLQLSSLTGGGANKGRSGQLSLQVVHRSATAPTTLAIASYNRDVTVTRALNTVEFSALDASGAPLALGSLGANPRIFFSTAPPLGSSLLASTAGTVSVGWATVKTPTGIAFATHGANGIAPVTTTTLVPGTSGATANSELTGTASITLASYAQNSIRLAPAAAGNSLTLSATTTLNTTAIALAGEHNFTLTGGTLGGFGPRFITVEKSTLFLASGLGTTQALVKSGGGVISLINPANTAATQPLAINNGTVFATPGTTLPAGELRFRGGTLGIVGGGTFARPFITSGGTPGPGTVNWSGLEYVTVPVPAVNTLPEDRGSGGFAAIDADASLDLGVAGVSNVLWEERGFVQSGFALILGGPLAEARITLSDNLSLSSGENTINYNAREIRVPDNIATTQDRALITGIVSGNPHNDLLKTGNGTLELTAANTFTGATIIQAGTLIISGNTNSTIVTNVMTGATLAGTGSTSAILLENGGVLAPGDGGIGTLAATSLTWRDGGIAKFDLGDRIELGSGNFEKETSSGVFAFDFGGTGALNQTYTLATFGSTTFTASDFSATNLASGVTGQFVLTGTTLVFSTLQPPLIDNWRVTHFGPGAGNSGDSADSADPDNDGISNLAEYALSGNPTIPATAIAPGYTLPGGVGTFAFTRNLAATDIALRIEARDSLTTGIWQTIATLEIGETIWITEPGISVTDPSSGSVTITDTAAPGSQSQRFLRLAIDRP